MTSDLKGIHYSQQTAEVLNCLFNKGEDAIPFVCDEYLLVADGLGGDGCYVHTKMNPDLWDKEKRKEIFEVPEQDEILLGYFERLFAEMDRDNEDGKKPERFETVPKYDLHSGYFASRIAAYYFVYLLRHDDRFLPKKLFSDLDAAENDEQYQQCLDQYAADLCEELMKKIRSFADREGFEVESDRNSAKLLPTTLTAALHRTIGEETQVICLWAGDSRIIAQLPDGCAQLTVDDEKDEGMTNLITLSIKHPYLNVAEYRFKRPFALFAVSDGTFDDMGEHVCFEVLVTLNAMVLDTPDEMQKWWSDLFEGTTVFGIRSTDDSATIAYHFFGLESMDACKEFIQPRVTEIEEKYLAEIPELLNVDFEIELQRLRRKTKSELRKYQDSIKNDPNVFNSFKEDEKKKSPRLISSKDLLDIDKERNALKKRLFENFEEIKNVYRKNWLKLRTKSKDNSVEDIVVDIEHEKLDKKRIREKYLTDLTTLKKNAEEFSTAMSELIEEGITEAKKGKILPIPYDTQKKNNAMFDYYKKELIEKLKDYYNNKKQWKEYCEDYNEHRAIIKKMQDDLVVLESNEVSKKADQAIQAECGEQLPEEVQPYWRERKQLEDQLKELEKKREEAIEAIAKKRAEESMGNILDNLMNNNGLLERLSEGLRTEISVILEEFWKEAEELKEKSEKQKEIFEETDKHYLRFIQEDKS